MEILINKKKFNVIEANTFFKRLIGLMGKKEIKYGMFFPKTRSIHTFFMRDNIDLLMINKEGLIIYLEKNIKRNRIIIKKEAYHTIELPKNTIHNIKINDQVIIQ